MEVDISPFNTVAGYAALLYDWVLCLSDEIDLVWPSKRSIPKWVYLLDKYLAMATLFFVNLGNYP